MATDSTADAPAEAAALTPATRQPSAAGSRKPPAFLTSPCTVTHRTEHITIWEATFCGRPVLVKCSSQYTLPRLQQEMKFTLKARKLGIRTPVVYHVDQDSRSVVMQRVPGTTMEHLITSQGPTSSREASLASVGCCIATLHDGGMVHGNLRLSHLLFPEDGDGLVVLNFAQAQNTIVPEHRAADLHRLEACLLADHPDEPQLFETIMQAYKKRSRFWSATLNRMQDVKQKASKRARVA